MLLMISFQTEAYAYKEIELASGIIDPDTGIIDPDKYNPGSIENAFDNSDRITSIGATVIDVIRVIGAIVTVIVLMILGIKYMMGSVEEKADYKKSMIPYLIGVVIFFSLSQILPIIMELAMSISE